MRKPSRFMNGWLYASIGVFLLCLVGMFILVDGCMSSTNPACQSRFDYPIDLQVLAVYAALTWPIAILLLIVGVIVQTVRNHRRAARAVQTTPPRL